ncbi:glycoside hydrolase family protein [Rhodopirellula maiorica SM1]|uniref:endo-1,4-beta-xylanase n=1 Tax=Rhodopirellula maiorica SM1 TaxID=1265738 RepID=M5RC30_9BACT|nr:endo-1,4-beta-xylanase [Rhodopirellula maiorica]EMI16935.1 glycoside hydrolase family protein [Rhodopirellula maiorica SM1]
MFTPDNFTIDGVNRCGRMFLAFVLLAGCFPAVSLAQATAITPPDGGRDVVSFGPDQEIEFRSQNVVADANWIETADMPFATAYSIKSDTRFSAPENMRLRIPIDGSVSKGDVVLISFWMRRPGAGGQPNNAYFFVDADSNSTSYQYNLSAYREWVQHVRSFVAKSDFDTAESCLRIQLGEAGTQVQIADLRLINYGPDRDIATLPKSTIMYKGREEDAAWRTQALARIEKIRKGDLTITVVDADGNPLPNARVHVAMQKHAFGFGNAVNSEVLGAAESDFPINPKKKIIVTWDEAQKYRQVVKKYFDRVTFESELRPHVWKGLKSDNAPSRRKYDLFFNKTLPWLLENNISVRGHYIAWAPMDFNAIEKQFVGDPEAHRSWLWQHMRDVLPATSHFVSEWDTINHIIGWGKHTYEKEYGGPEIYAEIMAEARRLAPDATHAINEGKVLPDGYKREPYKEIIRYLNEQGQPADIVGFMAHFGLASLTPPEELLKVYDEFGEIAPKLQLSEFDVDAGDDEALQADYFRDVMIASFSHPNFVAIVQWGFWEKMHWKPAAALWREDWSIKPAGEVFVDLVANQWWTDETTKTDDEGTCHVRGFLGDYQVHVQSGAQSATATVTLPRRGNQIRIQLTN